MDKLTIIKTRKVKASKLNRLRRNQNQMENTHNGSQEVVHNKRRCMHRLKVIMIEDALRIRRKERIKQKLKEGKPK